MMALCTDSCVSFGLCEIWTWHNKPRQSKNHVRNPVRNKLWCGKQKWTTMITGASVLTHWDRVTHICVGNLTIIGSDNGRHQAITNVGILLIGPLGTNFSEMLIEIHTFCFEKFHLKMSPVKWRPFCLDLNVLNGYSDRNAQMRTCMPQASIDARDK